MMSLLWIIPLSLLIARVGWWVFEGVMGWVSSRPKRRRLSCEPTGWSRWRHNAWMTAWVVGLVVVVVNRVISG